MVYLWRAVDAEGEVLDVLVQSKRNVLNNSEAVKGLAHVRFSTAPLDRRMRTSKRNCSSKLGASRVLSATPRRILPRAQQMASLGARKSCPRRSGYLKFPEELRLSATAAGSGAGDAGRCKGRSG